VDPGAREIPVGQIPTSSVKEAESVALNETMSFEMGMEYNALSLSNSYAKKPDFPPMALA
jgi:hypothetical protein